MASRYAANAIAVGPVLIGLLTLCGWWLDITVLRSVVPGFTMMKANTALGLGASGLGLMVLQMTGRDPQLRARLAAAFGTLAGALGALTLVEYATGISVGIDQLLFADPHTTSPPYPGRMAPATAVGLAGIGLSIDLLAWALILPDGRRRLLYATVAHAVVFVPAGIGYIGLADYVYNVPGLYSLGPFDSMALNTVFAFALLSLSASMTLPDLGWLHPFGATPIAKGLLVRLVPAAIILPFLFGGTVVWGARAKFYDPMFGPVLFAGAGALTLVGSVGLLAATIRKAEHRMQRMMDDLTSSRDLLRISQEAGHIGSWNWDLRTNRMHWSDEQYRLYGQDPKDRNPVVYATWFDSLHADDRQAVQDWMTAAVAGEVPGLDFEFRIVLPDAAGGALRWILARAEVTRDGTGEPLRLQGINMDITDRKRAEAVLARSAAELEALVMERTRALQETQAQLAQMQRMDALGQLAGGIAHDFSNILQAIQGAAFLIEKQPDDLERVRRLAGQVAKSVVRGSAITRRLLAFARRGDLRTEAINPVALLVSIREILIHTLGTGIGVRVDAAPDLPDLVSDMGQLETVLVNLAANARDAMSGAGTLTLAARAEAVDGIAPAASIALAPGRYVRLSVSDAGMGMTPDVLARASEPFFTTKEPGKGTGLGLAMARGFVEQCGGAILIESVVGQGTTVNLWLPVATREPVAETPAPKAIASHDARPSARLLVVDDDPLVLELLTAQLASAGYAVVAATDGAAALLLLNKGERVDMILSDLSMPGMDGLSLIREVQRRRPHLPAVLLTGFIDDATDVAVGAMAGQAFSVLRKPVSGAVLVERIAQMVAGVTAEL
jgi:PAS domain S-box-containing protein